MLYGTAETEPQADIVVAQLAQELYNSNLLLLLVQNLSRIDFEVCRTMSTCKCNGELQSAFSNRLLIVHSFIYQILDYKRHASIGEERCRSSI